MSTTTIRIEDDPEARVAAAFQALADERWARIRTSVKTVAWSDAKTYLNARANGENARKPTARRSAVHLPPSPISTPERESSP